MAVQDDRREKEMCELLGFRESIGRTGVDAYYDFKRGDVSYEVPLELKSSTNRSVSTARDVGLAHIEKWRNRIWVFGFYDSSGNTLRQLLTLGPTDMEPWIRRIETYIAPDFAIGERVALRLTAEDLHIVCGEKPKYSQADAQSLYKKQWNQEKYLAEMDVPNGYSPDRMLKILKLRAQYLNRRGSTLNNPHIPKSFFENFSERAIDVENTCDSEIARLTQDRIRQIVIANNALNQGGDN